MTPVHAAARRPMRCLVDTCPVSARGYMLAAGMRLEQTIATGAELAELDRRHIWHPFTQQLGWRDEPAPIIERASGVYLYDTAGNSYIDGVSSLWCNVHGHRHPRIDAAIERQLAQVAHTTMLGLSHAPAIELARRLVAIAPPGLQRVFYSDNGSTAVEVALKMAFQYWRQADPDGPSRHGFICLEDAYHGDTLGSVAVGGIELFHSLYRPLLFDTWKAPPGDAGAIERLLEAHAGAVAAVIVEPLVQGAAGMIMHPPGFLRAVRELCDRHDVFLICDEVAVGFGRTGTMFACEREGVTPDLMCVAKGITGGYLPLAATLTTERVYNGFLAPHEEFQTFFHGHTYTGNPLACAAALASLDLFDEEGTLEHVGRLTGLLERLLEPLRAWTCVAEVRQLGLMCGIELQGFAIDQRTGHRVTLAARERGAIIRPLGDTIVMMPPLAIDEHDLTRLVEIVGDSIAVVAR